MWLLRLLTSAFCVSLVVVAPIESAGTGTPPQSSVPAPNASGRELVQRKCAQCHQAGMWTSLRQDRRAWESTLYRMVGRGALWTPEEINAMAEYLVQIRGPAK